MYQIHVDLSLLDINNKRAILLFVGAAILTSFATTINQSAHAETGNGKDVFKVIMTVFGADKSKGDVVSIVTVNGGEASKVKFLDVDATPANPGSNGRGIIEYVATFPNVTVSTGEQYKACVLPVKTLEPICTTGSNSPALRPEFVDISLNATSTLTENGPSDDD